MTLSDRRMVSAVASLATTIVWLSASESVAQPGRLPEPAVTRGAQSSEAFPATRVTTAVRTLTRSVPWQPGDPIKEVPRRLTHPEITADRTPVRAPSPGEDQLVGMQRRAERAAVVPALSTPTLNLDGQGFTGVNPPDPVGDVGRRFYIQMTNALGGSTFTIYDKNTGQVIVGATDLDSLGTGVCANGQGDPIVLYDHLADRWLLSEFAPRGDDTLCVYVSATDDPTTGEWFAYAFTASDFPDYPKYAVWPDAYYMASNELSPTVYAFDRAKMLAGQPATFQKFTAGSLSGFRFQSLQPADLDGHLTPPAGTPAYFVRHRDDEAHNPTNNDPSTDFVELFEFRTDFADSSQSTFTGPFTVPITEFDSHLCGFVSFQCFEQPSGSNPLDPLRETVMWRVQYRSFPGHDSLVGNMVTDVNGNDRGGIRWFELRRAEGGPWTLFQEGTLAPDQHNRWMGSIAMDGAGNLALAYSIGSSSLPAGLRYTGRLANDSAGTLPQPERKLVDGSGSSASIRWGDYSSLNVDPVDDCTFWYTAQYANNSRWKTRIGRFSFEGCGNGEPGD